MPRSAQRPPTRLAPLTVVGVALVTVAAVRTPSQAGPTIAFVNTDVILRQTPGFAAAESTWTAEVGAMRGELEELSRRLDSALTAFNQTSIGLSPSGRQQKQAELQQLNQEYQQRTTDAQTRADARQRELMAPLEARVQSVIDGVRAERGVGIIFDVAAPGGGIVSGDPALDLTTLIVRRLSGAQ